ncbi:MAG: hypothetical protein KGH61_03825 [Candidatus Micrarchaeota archaeon]|nr:hypothetical protein [Candidatus Micrarchaeota archaeon]MDE1848050.1 hypothetical protein [Candidatus Micrarchaeota archaeon]MDE1864719.1 hypothetical protein [Candidatus Micrarchaeota archaeon]
MKIEKAMRRLEELGARLGIGKPTLEKATAMYEDLMKEYYWQQRFPRNLDASLVALIYLAHRKAEGSDQNKKNATKRFPEIYLAHRKTDDSGQISIRKISKELCLERRLIGSAYRDIVFQMGKDWQVGY